MVFGHLGQKIRNSGDSGQAFGPKNIKFQSEFHVWTVGQNLVKKSVIKLGTSKILTFDIIYSSYCLNFESSFEIDMLDSRY